MDLLDDQDVYDHAAGRQIRRPDSGYRNCTPHAPRTSRLRRPRYNKVGCTDVHLSNRGGPAALLGHPV
jgi:hypothetical protein